MAAAAENGAFALRGRFVQGVPGSPGSLELVEDGLVCVSGDGRISHFLKSNIKEFIDLNPSVNVHVLQSLDFCVPGMIDTHIHAPQYQYTGTATDLPLMEWLQKYTFPAESRCANTELALSVFDALVAKLLSHGTTTGVYYGSIHLEATKALVDVCRARGQRALVGKVAMDQHGAAGYEETTEAALRDTEALINYCHACEPEAADAEARLVNPVVTPRFIPTCSSALLNGLGALAAKHRERGCWVQSHMAESLDEEAFVEALHPGRRDAEIFADAGLLTDRTIMAHGVHLSDAEMDRVAAANAGIACCALSNYFFAHGAFRVREAQRRHVRVGLGTDIAGGYSPSLLVAGRHAVTASKVLSWSAPTASEVEIDYKHAFWMATIGGAMAIGLDHTLGHLAPGKLFDACVIEGGAGVYATEEDFSPRAASGHKRKADTEAACDALPSPSLSADFERWFNLGDDRNVRRVYVRGRAVHERDAPRGSTVTRGQPLS